MRTSSSPSRPPWRAARRILMIGFRSQGAPQRRAAANWRRLKWWPRNSAGWPRTCAAARRRRTASHKRARLTCADQEVDRTDSTLRCTSGPPRGSAPKPRQPAAARNSRLAKGESRFPPDLAVAPEEIQWRSGRASHGAAALQHDSGHPTAALADAARSGAEILARARRRRGRRSERRSAGSEGVQAEAFS